MNIKLSRRSISFIELLAKISTIFGIIPFYSFQTHGLKNIKLFKFYSLFLACLFPTLSINLLYLRFHYIYEGSSRNFIILDFLLEILSSVSFEITTLSFSMWNTAAWQKLFQCLHQLESRQHLDVELQECSSILINPNFLFVVGTVVIPLIYSSELYYHREEKYYCVMYISIYFYIYVEFLLANIIGNIALSIKDKYERISDLIDNVVNCSTKPEKTIEAIRKVKVLFLAVDNIVTIFNTLFGLPMLFMAGYTVVILLNCMVMLAGTSFKLYGVESSITPGLIAIYVNYTVVSCVSITIF